MKTIKQNEDIVFQGDVMFQRVDEMPQNVTKTDDNVIAHSETGHHHVAVGANIFKFDDLTSFMQVKGNYADIVHQRPFDTHETLRLKGEPGQLWKIRRQREYVPEGWRRVED